MKQLQKVAINLAVKWGLRNIELVTDSTTVFSWMNSVITEENRVRTTGASEMIIKRCLGVVKEREFNLVLTINLFRLIEIKQMN